MTRSRLLGVLALLLAGGVSTADAQDKSLRGFTIKAASQAAGEERNQQTDLWVLEVRFKPLRLKKIVLTDPRTGKKSAKSVWYLLYRAVNRPLPSKGDPGGVLPQNDFDPPPGKPLFAPEFTLVTNDNKGLKIYHDQILPEAQAVIAIRERLPQLKNCIQVVGPIPAPTPLGAKKDIDPIYGVVTWANIDPETDNLTIFMSGFSNGYKYVRGPVPYTTLAKNFSQGQLSRAAAVWDGNPLKNWTNLHDLLETSKTDPLRKQQIESSPWFFSVAQTAVGPPTGSVLWRKTLLQRYWRPGDSIDQDESEFFLRGPNNETYEPRWIYRPDAPLTAPAAPAAPPAASPRPTSN